MNRLIKALTSITDWLEEMGIPYMVFGGIANSLYGNPRQTFDIDIKFSLKTSDKMEPFLEELGKVAKILPETPLEFVEQTSVVPVELDDVRVDLVLAHLPFEEEAIQRSRYADFSGKRIKVCLPEDLIIQKAVSTREKDWMDIEQVISNQRHHMDWNYLLKHCKDLSDFLDDPSIYDRIKKWKDEEQV
jgi:predicted nucleotidyltransferase